MTSACSAVWLVYNGEAYNFEGLRAELSQAGHRFRTRSDTEVLVHGFEEWGAVGLARRLEGMFAFAVWEVAERRLTLVRDELGIKPLYYREDHDDGLSFASEAHALVTPDCTINANAVDGYLALGWVAGPETIWTQISELLPGEILVYADGKVDLRRWTVEDPQFNRDYGSGPDLHQSLLEAVSSQLMADVPVGLFLSGGLDSAAIATLAAPLVPNLTAFTVAFEGAANEGPAASRIAASLGINHEVVSVDGKLIRSNLPKMLASLDQPSVDGVNSWVVARAVRDAGAVVALSGVGGDELFGGYSTFEHVPRISRWALTATRLPEEVRNWPPGLMGRSRFTTHRRERRAFEAISEGGYGAAYAGVRGVLSRGERRWLRPAAKAQSGSWFVAAGASVRDYEMTNYLPFQLLRDTDAMSMAHSLEVRVPLLDSRVRAAAANLMIDFPPRSTDKSVLAAAVSPSLAAISMAPKRTFTLPIDAWLRDELAEHARADLITLGDAPLGFSTSRLMLMWEGFRKGRVPWRSIWALVVLGEWLNRTGDRSVGFGVVSWDRPPGHMISTGV